MKPNIRLAATARLYACFALSLVTCTPGGAQTKSVKHSPALAAADPQRVGVSPERLGRIDAMCEDAVKSGGIPGVVALVTRQAVGYGLTGRVLVDTPLGERTVALKGTGTVPLRKLLK